MKIVSFLLGVLLNIVVSLINWRKKSKYTIRYEIYFYSIII